MPSAARFRIKEGRDIATPAPLNFYHSTSVTQNIEHLHMVVGHYTLSFYYLSQILRSLPVADSVETHLTLPSLAPFACLAARIRLPHRKLSLSARIEPIGFLVVLVPCSSTAWAPADCVLQVLIGCACLSRLYVCMPSRAPPSS